MKNLRKIRGISFLFALLLVVAVGCSSKKEVTTDESGSFSAADIGSSDMASSDLGAGSSGRGR